MTDNEPKVELRLGDTEVILQGSEEFISNQLEKILAQIDASTSYSKTEQSDSISDNTDESSGIEVEGTSESFAGPIEAVANDLGVEAQFIIDHFYIDDGNIHLQDQYEIPHKYALIGYCLLKSEMDGTTIFDNLDTRDKLVEEERLPVEKWGGDLLYSLREEGLIKNDPDSSKERNIPFKITPKAERQFRDWLLADEDA